MHDEVHGIESGRRDVTGVAHLHRRRFVGEDAKPVARRMTGKIDQDIDAVGMNACGGARIVEVAGFDPFVRAGADARGGRIRRRAMGIAAHLEPAAVVMRHDRLDEETHRVVAKVRRDIADHQALVRRPCSRRPGEGLDARLARAPVAMRLHDLGRRQVVAIVKREQIARPGGVVAGIDVEGLAVGLEGLRVACLNHQRRTEIGVGDGHVRLDGYGAARCGDRVVKAVLVAQDPPEIGMRHRIVRIERDGFVETGVRALRIAQPLQRRTKVGPRGGARRVGFDGAIEMASGLARVTKRPFGDPHGAKQNGARPAGALGGAIVGEGLAGPAQVLQTAAKVFVRLGVARLAFDESAVAIDRVGPAARVAKRVGEIEVRRGKIRVDRDGLVEGVFRFAQAVGAAQQVAKIEPDLGSPGLVGHNRAIGRLCLVEAPQSAKRLGKIGAGASVTGRACKDLLVGGNGILVLPSLVQGDRGGKISIGVWRTGGGHGHRRCGGQGLVTFHTVSIFVPELRSVVSIGPARRYRCVRASGTCRSF